MRLAPPAIRALAFTAIACCVLAIAIAIGGGMTLHVGSLSIRSHNPLRPLAVAAALVAIALSAGSAALWAALAWQWEALQRYARSAAAVLALATIAAGFHWGAFVAGGSDSYCYLNQAELIARGHVRDYEPLAEDSSWPGNAWSFAPAGHMPFGQPVPSLVPICPSGYPLLMAAARLAAGRAAMFAITPVMGGLAIYLVFLLGRYLAGPAAGLLAAALSAASPTFLFQLFQPMNDVTAAALWVAALVAAWRASAGRRFPAAAGAGFLAAAAIAVRPNLVPLAAVAGSGVMLLARHRPAVSRISSGAVFAAAAAFGPLLVLAVQNAMYGSPFKSGYGDLDQMFSSAHVVPNLGRYLRWAVESHTMLTAAAVAAPFALKRYGSSRAAWWLLCFAAVTLACYLPYVVFDAWWYTRFLLPALLPWLALTAAVIVAGIEAFPAAARFPSLVLTLTTAVTLLLHIGAAHDVFRIRDLEWRFRSVGEFAATLPANAAFVTLHHSGSIRFYAARSTVGWADIEKGRLDDAVAFLRRHNRRPYLLFEGWEEPQFRERFAGERLGRLDWPPAAQVDGVKIYDPDDYDRQRRGEPINSIGMERKSRESR
jgi:4-amino-4-deoxy-L-arabinose transferase-like glycosyltransferase